MNQPNLDQIWYEIEQEALKQKLEYNNYKGAAEEELKQKY